MIEIQANNEWRTALFCSIIALFIILGLFYPILNVAALGMVAVSILLSNAEESICILIFLVSFSSIFKVTLGGFTFYNYAVLLGIIKGLTKSKFKINRHFGFQFFLFCGYVGIISARNDMATVMAFLCYIILFYLLYIPGTVSLRRITVFATWGIIITSIIALRSKQIPRLYQIMKEATIRLAAGQYYNRFSGLETNPNYYSLMISIIIAVWLVLIIEGKNKKIDYAYVGVLTVFGLLTVSQSFVISYAITIGGILFMSGKSGNKSAPLTVMMLAVVLVIAFLMLSQDTVNTLLFRFNSISSSNTMSEVTTGRSSLILYYLNYIYQNISVLLFGRGVGASNLPVGASHNYYVDIVYHLGLVGGSVYMMCLLNIFYPIKAAIRGKVYRFTPLFVFLVRALAINLIAREQLMFALLLCSASLYEATES